MVMGCDMLIATATKDLPCKMAIVAASAVFAPLTPAEAGNFDGGTFRFFGGYEHNDASFNGAATSGANVGLPVNASSSSTSDIGTLGFGFALNYIANAAGNVLVGVGIDYQPLKQIGSTQQLGGGGVGGQNRSTSIDVKSRESIYATLGYQPGKDQVGYPEGGIFERECRQPSHG
jgi:hypothetical protein